MLRGILGLLLLVFISGTAQATIVDDRYYDSRGTVVGKPTAAKKVRHVRHVKVRHGKRVRTARAGRHIAYRKTVWRGAVQEVRKATRIASGVIGGRPAGCPSRFCGCGASLEVFGRIIPALNLAANWLRFPRVSPAPGMVAARRGHVFVLRQHIAGNTWLVHDSNSGGRKTRIHPRSLAGFTVVNPKG